MKEGIDFLFQLVNLLEFNKDKEKYGFIKRNINWKFKDIEKNKMFGIFYNSLNNIEKFCENNITKEETINNMYYNLLLSQKEN